VNAIARHGVHQERMLDTSEQIPAEKAGAATSHNKLNTRLVFNYLQCAITITRRGLQIPPSAPPAQVTSLGFGSRSEALDTVVAGARAGAFGRASITYG